MTTDDLREKIEFYEVALDEILSELWRQTVHASEQRDNGVPFEEREAARLESVKRLISIACGALHKSGMTVQDIRPYIM